MRLSKSAERNMERSVAAGLSMHQGCLSFVVYRLLLLCDVSSCYLIFGVLVEPQQNVPYTRSTWRHNCFSSSNFSTNLERATIENGMNLCRFFTAEKCKSCCKDSK